MTTTIPAQPRAPAPSSRGPTRPRYADHAIATAPAPHTGNLSAAPMPRRAAARTTSPSAPMEVPESSSVSEAWGYSCRNSSQAVLAALDLIEVWHLAVGCFLSGIFWSGDVSVRRILLGEIAGPGRVAQGIAYDSLSNNVTRMLGPLLGGGLLQLFGLTGTFLLGFGCCLAIALLLLAVRDPAQPATGGTLRVGANLVAGIRLARASPLVIGLLLVTVIFNLFSFPTSSMVPVVGEGLLALSPLWVGLLAACEGAGATVGSLAIALFARAGWYRRIYWGGLTLAMLSIQVFAQADWAPLAGLALFVMGIGVAGFSSMQTTLVFLSVPPQARSRVMGLVSFCIGTAPLGLLLVGWLAGELGPGTALTVLSGAGLVALGLVLWRWREVR